MDRFRNIKYIKTENLIFSTYLNKNKNKQTKKLENEKIYKNIKAKQQQQEENTQSNSFWHTFYIKFITKNLLS